MLMPPSESSSTCASGKAVKINQVIGLLDVFAHQINEIRAAAQELRVRSCVMD